METNEITSQVIAAAMRVHSILGPGLLESAYRACMCREFELRGIRYEKELPVPITYFGVVIHVGYRLDLQVEDRVIVELKAVSRTTETHEAQLLSHLNMGRKSVGLLINFHVRHLRHGIKRMVNNFKE